MGMPPTIEVASLGMWDSLVLMVMALVVFGPRRLPEIGRQIGKLMYEVRKASNDFKFQMEEELRKVEDTDRRKKDEERLSALALAGPASTAVDSQASESKPGTPAGDVTSVPDGQFSTPSPYPEETVYPPVTAAACELPAEESYPRILPPSIGTQVPAARPGSLTAQAEAPAENKASAQAGEAPAEVRAADTAPATKQERNG
jgi:sec-independent protein translocase protein TatB